MTVLPELRDQLVRAHPAPVLPQLRDGLAGRGPRRRRRAASAAALTTAGLAVTAGALAATGVIPIGSPVKPAHANRDPHAGVGVPVAGGARLLPLRAPDPAGGPPWGMQIVRTSRGLTCLQVGRVVNGRLGVLGQDGIAGDDGRFHPLPATASVATLNPCVAPDGAGHLYIALDTGSLASGPAARRACAAPDESAQGRPACPAADRRQVAFGLLGAPAAAVTFANGTKQAVSAPLGAYLYVGVPPAGAPLPTMGGGAPAVGLPSSAVRRIDYRDGTSCPPLEPGKAVCPIKGYVAPRPPRDSPALRRPLRAVLTHMRIDHRSRPAVRVSFRAPRAITLAERMYLLQGRFPAARNMCRRVILFVPTDRDIAAGERVSLIGPLPPQCHGRLSAAVLLVDETSRSGRPGPTVGRFSLRVPERAAPRAP
jgi:hypothetical protein